MTDQPGEKPPASPVVLVAVAIGVILLLVLFAVVCGEMRARGVG